MRYVLAVFAALIFAGCAGGGMPAQSPVKFIQGGGSGFVELELYGQPISIKLEAIAVEDEAVEFCPVVILKLWGAVWRGTYPGAPDVCREQFGVIGIAPTPAKAEAEH